MKYVFEPKAGYFYYRRGGKLIPLPGKPGTPEFHAAYQRVHVSFGDADRSAVAEPGTFNAMAQAYLSSAEYLQNLKPQTRAAYRYDLDILRKSLGRFRPDDIDAAHVLHLRDKYAATPGKANTLIRTLRAVYHWGILRRLAKRNPADLHALGVKALKIGQHRPWTQIELEKVRISAAPHLVLAMELALWTGQRQGDLVRLRWDDIKGGHLYVVQEKTGKALAIPVVSPLVKALAAAPKPALTILVNSKGRPWQKANPLAQAFGDELTNLGLEGCVFHGLRKTTAVALAEAGCSTKEIAAITGQSDQMVEHYTKGADQKRMAGAAVVKLERSMKRKPVKV